MINGERWPPGRMLQGRPKRTFHQRDSWWWGGHISNWIPCTLLHAELDFSRGIWAAARDGEEDRIKHLLSRFPNATHCQPIILNPGFSCAYHSVMLHSYSFIHPYLQSCHEANKNWNTNKIPIFHPSTSSTQGAPMSARGTMGVTLGCTMQPELDTSKLSGYYFRSYICFCLSPLWLDDL